MDAVAFDSHPYSQPVIGWMSDINGISVEDCKNFFRTYYAPNNAILCVVGDFDPKMVRPLLKTAFGDIPAQTPPAPVLESEDPQTGERRLTVEAPAEQPAVAVSYHMGARRDPDFLTYDLLSSILGAGESSRLFRDLVYDHQVASGAAAWIDGTEHPGLLTVWADVIPGKTPEEVIARIDSVVQELVTKGVTKDELDKARNQALASQARQLTTNGDRAVMLLMTELLDGNYQRIFRLARDYDRVTPADVDRVARACLRAQNRTIGVLVPKDDTASLESGAK
jgi:predicted Zn-dependent peptidase